MRSRAPRRVQIDFNRASRKVIEGRGMESKGARERGSGRARRSVNCLHCLALPLSCSPALPLPRSPSLFDLIEADVEDGVLLPIFVVEVPPLEFINGEALRFHRL